MTKRTNMARKGAFFTIALIGLALLCNACEAQVFDFVQRETDDVLARLELSSLPANHSDIVGLTFTEAGQAIFGLGPVYDGTFDLSSRGMVIENTTGVLLSDQAVKITFLDEDPVQFVREDGTVGSTTGFRIKVEPDGDASLEVAGTNFFVVTRGEFRAVPVPETLLGDCNLDGVVDFLDISTFISFLSVGYQAQADINDDGIVNFLDISPFIALLSS